MTLNQLIQTNAWASVAEILVELYPAEKENLDGYALVYEKLKFLNPEECDMYIELKNVTDDFDGEPYVDISGKYKNPKTEEEKFSMAIEFTPWSQWLGMDICPESIEEFSELEIIAHCLYEMTFAGFEEKDIQEELNNIKETAEEAEHQNSIEEEDISAYIDNLLNVEDEEDTNKNKPE
ncbi:DUF6557 family protein [Haloflavibacter putidus]|uniref:Uncharacterized protein n=1 Tax=Haloflavibacter putidus TaxID=2576776 RepID=A0A507ZMA1_9FLAO|nr:DUF6557 family protein [Haloflavibacter putidus]TQD38826.1 hypothetical protein FKR84_07525 [Haloflavibacter putidus]